MVHKHVKHLSFFLMKMIFAFVACGIWLLLLWTSLPWWVKFVIFPIVLIASYFVFVNTMMNLMKIGHPNHLRRSRK